MPAMCWEMAELRNDLRKNLSEIFFSTETSHMADLLRPKPPSSNSFLIFQLLTSCLVSQCWLQQSVRPNLQ